MMEERRRERWLNEMKRDEAYKADRRKKMEADVCSDDVSHIDVTDDAEALQHETRTIGVLRVPPLDCLGRHVECNDTAVVADDLSGAIWKLDTNIPVEAAFNCWEMPPQVDTAIRDLDP
ncbi:hypothetical protein BDZ89DRAFT_481945 [Hymenopellis radicata]|nr:hypothetical protein BDZ89DRAFT_481945 [Hymenopellis radicata]